MTVVFTLAQNVLTIAVALVLAFATDRVIRGRGAYKAIILLPYAIAPVDRRHPVGLPVQSGGRPAGADR